MTKLRQVEYYTSDTYDPEAGFMDGDNENDNQISMGILYEFVDSIQYVDGKPFQVTKALIQDRDTQKLSTVSIEQLKWFKDWSYWSINQLEVTFIECRLFFILDSLVNFHYIYIVIKRINQLKTYNYETS